MSTEERLRAESIHRRNVRDLEEARKLNADALVALLTERVSVGQNAFDLADQRTAMSLAADAARREAESLLAQISAARFEGSLDPSEAVKLRDAEEVAQQRVRILTREAEAAASAALAPYQPLIKLSSDAARTAAEHAIDAVLSAAREGGDRLSSHVRDAIGRHRGQPSAVWLPFFAARGIALYSKAPLRNHPRAVEVDELRAALDHLVARCNAE